jgi:O-antigen/teichoic acid export membrane protein
MHDIAMYDLKQKVIRGGFAKLCSQGTNFTLRIGSLMVLARLLGPSDFGLVGMVMAVIGVLNLFKDFGLSTAAVQKADISDEQHSALFWLNMLVGGILAVLAAAMSPLIATLYHEPRLVAVTLVLAASFIINAAGVQHGTRLQRELRFTTLAVIEIVALAASIGTAVGMALCGFKYWSLVAMAVISPFVNTVCLWAVAGWIPAWPRRGVTLLPMVRFGATVTVNGLVVYVGYNLEKLLLGRSWGAAALGLYGRAYQLVNVPTDNMNSAAGGVVFAALSRLQAEPERLRSYFLKGYSLVLAVTLPLTIVCSLFAHDLILVLLGPKWDGADTILRFLAPTILIFALINPLGWLLMSLGMVGRSLRIALVISPIVISGYLIGLPYGPQGVALGYSTAMSLWVVPHIAWSVRGTGIRLRDVGAVLSRPLLSGLAAGLLPAVILSLHVLTPLPRLMLGGGLFAVVYLAMLLGVMRQKSFYVDIMRGFRRRALSQKAPASA